MVTLADAIAVLAPGAVPLADYVVRDDGTGPRIAAWGLPGDPPTAEQLAAVTQGQVEAARTAKARAAAGRVVLESADPAHVATRAADSVALTQINNVIEMVQARFALAAAGNWAPTNQQLADAITANRAGRAIDPTAPTPAEVVAATDGRQSGAFYVGQILANAAAGGGDPIPGG